MFMVDMTLAKQIVKKSRIGALFAVGFFAFAPLLLLAVPAQAATEKLDCAVLPQPICDSANTQAGKDGDVSQTGVFKLLEFILGLMTAGVGIVAVGAIIYAGILYTSAGDNQQQVTQAKDTIKNTAIGLIAFGLMYLILNWLIPGGVFK